MIRKAVFILCVVMLVMTLGLWAWSYACDDFVTWGGTSWSGSFSATRGLFCLELHPDFNTGVGRGIQWVPLGTWRDRLSKKRPSILWGRDTLPQVTYLIIYAPFWWVAVFLALYPIYGGLYRSLILPRSRRRRGLCVLCGYDLTGNTSGQCPECGNGLENATG